jgi:hypothetical protein
MPDAPNASSSQGPDHGGATVGAGRQADLPGRHGARARRLRWAAIVVAAVAAVVLASFVASLVILPRLTHLAVSSPAYTGHVKHGGAMRGTPCCIASPSTTVATGQTRSRPRAPSPGAWFAPWEDGALDSFRHHAADLTHVYPTWLELSPDGKGVLTKDYDPARNPTTAPLVQAARANGVRIVPIVGNATEGLFDPHRIDRMLDGAQRRRRAQPAGRLRRSARLRRPADRLRTADARADPRVVRG